MLPNDDQRWPSASGSALAAGGAGWCGGVGALDDVGDELVAAAPHRAHDALGCAVVADGLTERLDPAGQGGVADEAVTPHRVEELLLGDHPMSLLDQQDQHVEHLRLDRAHLPVAAQLVALWLELAVPEDVAHRLTAGRSAPA